MSIIEIYRDEQAGVTPGWAYRHDDGPSGAIDDGDAIDAIERVIAYREGADLGALRYEIEHTHGDAVIIRCGIGSIYLGDLLDRD